MTSTITTQGRAALSSKAGAQKASGRGGKFGHLQHAEASALSARVTVPEEHRRYLAPADLINIENGSMPSSTDPRVANGEVFDKLYDPENFTVWTREKEGVWPDSPYSMRLQTNIPLDDEGRKRLSQLAGYAWRATVHGESLDWPSNQDDYSVEISADSTKGRGHPGDFSDKLREMITDGSPMRKTKDNTRLIEGFGQDVSVEVYWDDVNGPSTAPAQPTRGRHDFPIDSIVSEVQDGALSRGVVNKARRETLDSDIYVANALGDADFAQGMQDALQQLYGRRKLDRGMEGLSLLDIAGKKRTRIADRDEWRLMLHRSPSAAHTEGSLHAALTLSGNDTWREKLLEP